MYVLIFPKKSMNILTCVFPQSDGQAESQYAAARKATQDRFGFYQVTIRVLFLLFYLLMDIHVLFIGGFLSFVCFIC